MEQSNEPPRWPWGFGFAAFIVALLFTFLFAGILAAALDIEPGGNQPASFTVAATAIQDTALVAAAVFFAAMVARPRAWQFGLRRTRFWPAVGWAALGMLVFYFFTVIYGALVQPDAEQEIAESLGADQGTIGLIVAGCVVMILAPLAEETFFRGFFYASLRSKFGIAFAALTNGVVFGIIHWDFSSLDKLLIIPPLMLLGVIFCLVYEKTGSLWPAVGMHAFNNAVAYAATVDNGWKVSVVVGPLMIAVAMLAPRVLPTGPRGLPGERPHPAVVR